MAKRIILAGAHSYLGQKVVEHLRNRADINLLGIISPWGSDSGIITGKGIEYTRADLAKTLTDKLASEIRSADLVLQFAWKRGGTEPEILSTNRSILKNVKEHVTDPEKLVFISSVAASPGAFSGYGRVKFRLANELREWGAVILVTGLIVDKEPRGPYALLSKVVKKSPIAVRFKGASVPVYPITTEDFLLVIDILIDKPLSSGTYRVFGSRPVDLNDMLAAIERKQGRSSVKIPLPYGLTLGGVSLLSKVPLFPSSLSEKLLTFLYKDEEYLAQHTGIPGTEFLDKDIDDLI
ncbi:MAG: hypothetical protein JO053_09985 [Acidobacteria bacterium]|nr:hypothetical protein [Acidobacteriota bacterium]